LAVDDEKRNEITGQSGNDNYHDEHGKPDSTNLPARDTPGDANPALAETLGYEQGSVSTAELLSARETGEARLAGASQDRDSGLAGRPLFHEAPALPITGFDAEENIYEREELHTLDEEPEMHGFAPGMTNIPTARGQGSGIRGQGSQADTDP
jgi:hypothetical protein